MFYKIQLALFHSVSCPVFLRSLPTDHYSYLSIFFLLVFSSPLSPKHLLTEGHLIIGGFSVGFLPYNKSLQFKAIQIKLNWIELNWTELNTIIYVIISYCFCCSHIC